MKEILLTDDQAKTLAESHEPVEFRHAAGTVVVKVDPYDAQALASFRRHKSEGAKVPGIPGSRVREHLAALQAEWDRTGGFDRAHLHAILEKLHAEDNA